MVVSRASWVSRESRTSAGMVGKSGSSSSVSSGVSSAASSVAACSPSSDPSSWSSEGASGPSTSSSEVSCTSSVSSPTVPSSACWGGDLVVHRELLVELLGHGGLQGRTDHRVARDECCPHGQRDHGGGRTSRASCGVVHRQPAARTHLLQRDPDHMHDAAYEERPEHPRAGER